jgi:hypothetical protein
MAKSKKLKLKEFSVTVRVLFQEQITATSADEAESILCQKIDNAICNRYQSDDLEWEFSYTNSDEIK